MTKATVTWDNPERTAIRFDIQVGCAWPDFWAAVHQAQAWIETVDHAVDLIINPDPGAAPPLRALANFRQAQEDGPANQGRLIIVGVGLYVELLFNTFTRIYPRLGEALTLVSSLEKARAALAEQAPRPTSPDKPPTWR